MRNFARINNYYNKMAAWQDWNALCDQAVLVGLSDKVKELQPPADAGWRLIDKRIGQLRRLVESEIIKREESVELARQAARLLRGAFQAGAEVRA